MLFKVGDIVRFIMPNSPNARYFNNGLENLKIRSIHNGTSYTVYECDKSNSWIVGESELELMNKQIEEKIDDKMEVIKNGDVLSIVDNDGDCIDITIDQLRKIWVVAFG